MNAVHEQPLSWLTLERYALGELDPAETRRVEAQLARSPEDRECLESILNDDSELPELPTLLRPQRELPELPTPLRPRRTRLAPLLGVGASLAAAAAMLFVLLKPEDATLQRQRHVLEGAKGGDVALTLRSDRQDGEPSTFAAGERFKLLVTTPPWFERPLTVVVFQDGERFEPLPSAPALARGNQVPWPSAFSLDGDAPAQVCVTWGENAQAAARASDLGDTAVCTELEPREAD